MKKIILGILILVTVIFSCNNTSTKGRNDEEPLCDSLIIIFRPDNMKNLIIEEFTDLADLVRDPRARQITISDIDTVTAFKSHIDSLFNPNEKNENIYIRRPMTDFAVMLVKDRKLTDIVALEDNPIGFLMKGQEIRKDSLFYNAVMNVLYDRITKYIDYCNAVPPTYAKEHNKHAGTHIENGRIFNENGL